MGDGTALAVCHCRQWQIYLIKANVGVVFIWRNPKFYYKIQYKKMIVFYDCKPSKFIIWHLLETEILKPGVGRDQISTTKTKHRWEQMIAIVNGFNFLR